jgi:hypothetical protein
MAQHNQPELFAMPAGQAVPKGRNDAARVANEREIMWPPCVTHLQPEKRVLLFGDIPEETRLTVQQVCRRLSCDSNTVYRHIDAGNLTACNIAVGAERPQKRVYRWSLVEMIYKNLEGDWSE